MTPEEWAIESAKDDPRLWKEMSRSEQWAVVGTWMQAVGDDLNNLLVFSPLESASLFKLVETGPLIAAEMVQQVVFRNFEMWADDRDQEVIELREAAEARRKYPALCADLDAADRADPMLGGGR